MQIAISKQDASARVTRAKRNNHSPASGCEPLLPSLTKGRSGNTVQNVGLPPIVKGNNSKLSS